MEKLVRKKLIVIEKRRGDFQQFANNRYEIQAFAGFGKSNPGDKRSRGSDPRDMVMETMGHCPAVAESPPKENQYSKKNQKMIRDEFQKPSSSGITLFLLDHSPNVSSPKNSGIIEAEKSLTEAGATLEDCEDAEFNGFLIPHLLVPTNAEIDEPWPAQIAGGVMEWLKLKKGQDEFWV